MEFSIINKSKGTPPRVPFRVIAEDVLGKSGSVSLAFLSPAESKKINKMRRGKEYVANILTFPFSKKNGEILICLSEAKKSSKKFNLSYRNMVTLLFIHGLLHLKGTPHGVTMEQTEQRLLKRFTT